MLIDGIKGLMIFIMAIFLGKMAFAADYIELPTEELAKESVLPVFDRAVSVKSRNIVTEKRVDIGLFYGMAMTEPIQNVSKLGLSGYYHINEEHALGVMFTKNSSGLSSYAKQLENVKGADGSTINLDLTRAPIQESMLLVDYNIKPFYGKMSVTKNTVLNLSLFGSAALGMVKYVHKSYPAIALGLGQKFYFTRNFAARFDMRLHMHNAPIPFLAGHTKKTDPVATYSQYDERMTYTTNLDVGITYLF